MTKVYEIIEQFLSCYLIERNREKALNLVTDDIYAMGAGRGIEAENKEELGILLQKGMDALPCEISFQIRDFREKKRSAGCWDCLCQIELTDREGAFGYHSITICLTAGVMQKGDQCCISLLHLSETNGFRKRGRGYPLRFVEGRTNQNDWMFRYELMETISKLMPGGIIGGYLEKGYPIYVIDDAFLDSLGYTYEEFLAQTDGNMENSIYEEDRKATLQEIERRLETGDSYQVEYRVLKKDGGYIWVFDIGTKITTREGRAAVISVIIDISENIRQKKHLMMDAVTDGLTKVYNRKGGERLVAKALGDEGPYVFLIMDIDNFKLLNDIYGHHKGDLVLQYVAKLLKKTFRVTDFVIRLGGDEFIIFLHPCHDCRVIIQKMERIIQEFKNEMAQRYPESHCSLSFGGVYGNQKKTFLCLYQMADKILYQVKRGKKGQYEIICADQKAEE